MVSKRILALLTVALFFLVASSASAAVIGTLTFNSGDDEAFVSLSYIDWGPRNTPPTEETTGTINTTTGTTLTYDGGSIGVGVTGTIRDLVLSGPAMFPVTGFITFASAPGLSLDLMGVGPGSSNTDCAGTTSTGDSCSLVLPGGQVSPFVLTRIGSQTSVALGVFGTATDSSGAVTPWNGTFTTQLTGMTPAQIEAFFAANPTGVIRSSYSAELVAVPEPTTFLLMGLGLIAIGGVRRKLRS
jgi:hypothetical protein